MSALPQHKSLSVAHRHKAKPYPSITALKVMMSEGYGQSGALLESLFYHCAVVAEAAFYNSQPESDRPGTTHKIAIKRYANGNSGNIRSGYICKCGYPFIRTKWNHCPECGVKLEFVFNLSKNR